MTPKLVSRERKRENGSTIGKALSPPPSSATMRNTPVREVTAIRLNAAEREQIQAAAAGRKELRKRSPIPKPEGKTVPHVSQTAGASTTVIGLTLLRTCEAQASMWTHSGHTPPKCARSREAASTSASPRISLHSGHFESL